MSEAFAKRICTRTHKIAIERLKGIRGLEEVSLEEHPITGIFGPNGAGKSTVLHALAAAYKAPEHATNHEYKKFFPRLTEDAWTGTRFIVTHSGTLNGNSFDQNEEVYTKGSVTKHWKPAVNRRPEREVLYIGLKDCLPALEKYSSHDLHGGTMTELDEGPDKRALRALGTILNASYAKAYELSLANYPTRSYSAFERTDITCTYPSVTMGSGEQRLFAMLQQIERTRKNALILIDEFDLLLHGDALAKLIDYLHAHCIDKDKQIVFTSHREELLRLDDKINIRHLYRFPDRHSCLNNTDPDSLHRLTGQRIRPLEIFVEDPDAACIVTRVAKDLGIDRHVETHRFGSAINSFIVSAGLLLKGENCDNSLFVIDGDVHRTSEEKTKQIDKYCSGDDIKATESRAKMTQLIVDFQALDRKSPEQCLHQMIISLHEDSLNGEEQEIRSIAIGINNPADAHSFTHRIVEELNGERNTETHIIVKMASNHPDWDAYVKPVYDWLEGKKAELNL